MVRWPYCAGRNAEFHVGVVPGAAVFAGLPVGVEVEFEAGADDAVGDGGEGARPAAGPVVAGLEGRSGVGGDGDAGEAGAGVIPGGEPAKGAVVVLDAGFDFEAGGPGFGVVDCDTGGVGAGDKKGGE